MTLVRFVVLKHGVIPASRGGKLKTIFQMVGIIMFLLPIDQTDTVLWLTRNVVMGIAVAAHGADRRRLREQGVSNSG